jgi:hypothetical protein
VIVRALTTIGVSDSNALVARDALLDWIDSDDDPRPFGAERAWYHDAHRPRPRNAELAHLNEIYLVRGFSNFDSTTRTRLNGAFGVEKDRPTLQHLDAIAFQAMSGVTSADASVLSRLQNEASGRVITLGYLRVMTLTDVDAALSGPSRDSLQKHFALIQGKLVNAPDSWLLLALFPLQTTSGTAARAGVEFKMRRTGSELRVVRRRIWSE